ncbi:MAG: hypothetical protein K1X31_05000 [Gemmatimonadaceae bacterium]|nr:hypothetical protein [Gemmatimonadaceae bacterium]
MIALLAGARVVGAQGGGAQVTARIIPDSVGVGEPFSVELRVRAPISAEVRFPALPDSSDVVEPLDPRAVRDASTASVLDRTALYRLIAWDTGQRVLRFADITVTTAGATVRYPVRLPPVSVRSVLPADSARRVPRAGRDLIALSAGWWRWLVAAAVILPLGAFGWRAWRRRRAARAALGPDAAEVARDGFNHAGRLGLLEAGEHGRFALAHVAVMRRYLAERFPQAAPSRTARELAAALVGSEFPILPERVAALVLRVEPIAFARAPVSADEARGVAGEARAIVQEVETALKARADRDRRPRRRPL